ncbi:hypothetical protein PoB_006978400 [Plakobranchus ocellatus]|uniref:Uncharacterized protein n=1 Tax=Plakobranchus ocellatus TaxID=259542 RepID=A0AAV4DG99_9GAST|nr:hypothetical protein PoB_006978400 [Plakobranchus ocellatus]
MSIPFDTRARSNQESTLYNALLRKLISNISTNSSAVFGQLLLVASWRLSASFCSRSPMPKDKFREKTIRCTDDQRAVPVHYEY